MRFEKIVNGFAYEAKVAICDHFLRVFADGPDDFFHFEENGVVFKILQGSKVCSVLSVEAQPCTCAKRAK